MTNEEEHEQEHEHRRRRFASWRVLIGLLGVLVALEAITTPILWIRVQQSRSDAITVTCRIDNAQNSALRKLIVRGAEGSRLFEPLYRRFHAPPFPERLKAARRDAATLPPLNCAELLKSVGVPQK